MELVRPNIKGLHPYVGGAQIENYDLWAKLNQNEFPYPPSPRVLEAIRTLPENKRYPINRYPPGDHKELKERLAGYLHVRPTQISFGDGSDENLGNIAIAFVGDGNSLVYPYPISFSYPEYSMFPNYAELQGVDKKEIDLNDDFTINVEAFIDGKPVLAYLSRPNSPSGISTPKENIVELCEKSHPRIVAVDEAYSDFAGDDCLDLLQEYPNLLLTRTFSKADGLAGLRLGYTIGHEKIIERLEAIRYPYNVNIVAYVAGLAALEDESLVYKKEKVREIKEWRSRLTHELTDLGLYVFPSQANFILMQCDSPEEAERIFTTAEYENVLLRYFKGRRRLEDKVRMTIGTSAENEKGLNVIRKVKKAT
ncbi:MAG: histidinol-phosphate transaminase [Candidatus Aenigmarchaeota archaeon]|nr:histidinol-phosphate transaminase [Candidatus Aenigmarchaeota archaeon]